MTTSMKSLAGKNTLQVHLVAFKNKEKACIVDITEMSPKGVGKVIELQKMQDRTFEYHIIKRYSFPDFGEVGSEA